MASVPGAALSFLFVICALLAILILIFLYINKKACFAGDRDPLSNLWGRLKHLGYPEDKRVQKYSTGDDSSSDSDDEMIRRYQSYIASKRPVDETTSLINSSPTPTPPDREMTPVPPESDGEADAQSIIIDDMAEDALLDASAILDETINTTETHASIQVTLFYSSSNNLMTVKVGSVKNLLSKAEGGPSHIQAHLLLMGQKKVRHKSKIKSTSTPMFNEKFKFQISVTHVEDISLRLRLYQTERLRKAQLIGESVIKFNTIPKDKELTQWYPILPKSDLNDSMQDLSNLSGSDSDVSSLGGSSTASVTGKVPELLIGLSYSGINGRLTLEVIKGSNFYNKSSVNRAPDSYVKIILMSANGKEIGSAKTSLRRAQYNPVFKEVFKFQVASFLLADVTLMVSVYFKKGVNRKVLASWFSIGLNNSGSEQLAHWNDMQEAQGEEVCRWHQCLVDK